MAGRFVSSGIYEAVDHGVPLFLRQLVETLRREQRTAVRDDVEPGTSAPTEIGRAAALHGSDLMRLGFSVDQVVYGYGDVCQSITDLAVEQKADIAADEFRTLNRCLDNAIAHAVTAFGRAHQILLSEQAETLQQHLTHFSEEQRRLVYIATQAYSAIKTGNIGLSGATGSLLVHALTELGTLVDRTFPELRPASASPVAVAA